MLTEYNITHDNLPKAVAETLENQRTLLKQYEHICTLLTRLATHGERVVLGRFKESERIFKTDARLYEPNAGGVSLFKDKNELNREIRKGYIRFVAPEGTRGKESISAIELEEYFANKKLINKLNL